jgi:hypothetical protein
LLNLQAIAAGKALKSNVPTIFEVPYIEEPVQKALTEELVINT